MTTLLALLSLVCVSVLVALVCLFVARMRATLRSAEDCVNLIAAFTRAMRQDAAAISPDIESMNQNLYRVAAYLTQLGEAAERMSTWRAGPTTRRVRPNR